MTEKGEFLWGCATSSHQVEGNNMLNDWWEWETSGKLKEASGLACDHYRRYREDFEIAKNLGHSAHRFSLEWSRLEPKEGRWDDTAWNHYKKVVDTLRSLGIEPIVTLNHFTLPLWFYKKGGWHNSASVESFKRYAKKAVEVFGDRITYWVTLNEPMVFAACAYFLGKWPPGVSRYRDTVTVIEHLILAHAHAYKIMHTTAGLLFPDHPLRIGIAKNVYCFEPYDARSIMDKYAAFTRHHFYNHLILTSLRRGFVLFPGFRMIQLPQQRSFDFIGANYYSRQYIRSTGKGILRLLGNDSGIPKKPSAAPWKNYLGWEIYPKGLYVILKDLAKYAVPILVSENGICTNDDPERARFIKEHLDALLRAKQEGAPVIGYLYWSLLDNFEWADGYGPRFGLVEVNYKTQERKIRQSAFFFSLYMKEKILLPFGKSDTA